MNDAIMATNMNKIITKPQNRGMIVRKPFKATAEQEQALRDQIHIEIENKSKACSNHTYDCSIPRVEGYEFCVRHILQDPRAPFKQCAYTYSSSGKKCLQPAPKYDGKKEPGLTNYCFEHSRFIQLMKIRNVIGKYKQVESNEAFMNDLTHHIKVDGHSVNFAEADEEIDVVSANADPFIHCIHSADLDFSKIDNTTKRRLLDYASDSSSDEDMPTTSNTWRSYEWENSDNESVDSQNEDMLKHAGIYTTEEATMITKQKMMRLQVLYMEQILRMQHLMKEKRRKYLHAMKKDREYLYSVPGQPKENSQVRKLYRKLKALNRYHKKFGAEAILYKKFKEKRDRVTDGVSHKCISFQKCMFSEGGVKCGDRAVPSCKYCKKHILEDKKQVLFRACGIEKSGIVCQEPVANIFEDGTCVLHLNLPPAKAYIQKKFESETEEDEEVGVELFAKKFEDIKEGSNKNMPSQMDLATKAPVLVTLTASRTAADDIQANIETVQEINESTNGIALNLTISHEQKTISNPYNDGTETNIDADVEMDKLEVTDSPKPEVAKENNELISENNELVILVTKSGDE